MQPCCAGDIDRQLKKLKRRRLLGVLLPANASGKGRAIDFQKLILSAPFRKRRSRHVLARVTMAVGETSLEAMEVFFQEKRR